jgi:hypothetical protein
MDALAVSYAGELTRLGTRVKNDSAVRPLLEIAVGTALAGGPPRRSQRALLTHWAPALGASVKARVGVGMLDAGRWEPSSGEAVHALPVQA